MLALFKELNIELDWNAQSEIHDENEKRINENKIINQKEEDLIVREQDLRRKLLHRIGKYELEEGEELCD
jgi:hypothetical protein